MASSSLDEETTGKVMDSSPFGKGTTGKVYRTTNDKVVKVFDPMNLRDLVGPFCMNHPNIIKVDSIEIDEENNAKIVMEKGKTCAMMQNDNFLDNIVDYIKQILAGLLFIHSNGIVHSDMKCENTVKIGDLYKIIDFGTAVLSNGRRTPSELSGLYTAPEMNLRNDYVVAKSDIYMFGFSLMYIVSGRMEEIEYGDKTIDYIMYQDSILGNREELFKYLNVEMKNSNRYNKYSQYNPKNVYNAEINSLIKMMTQIDPNERSTAEELLKLPIFNTIPYRIKDQWYRRYPHQEPQYHDVHGDNRTDITLDNLTMELLEIEWLYMDNLKHGPSISWYMTIELAYSIFQHSIERNLPRSAELKNYSIVAVSIANTLISSHPLDTLRNFNDEIMEVYYKTINSSGMSIVCNSLTSYLMAEFEFDEEDLEKILQYLIMIWSNNRFVEVRARKKCVIAIKFAEEGTDYLTDSEDSDMIAMSKFLRYRL